MQGAGKHTNGHANGSSSSPVKSGQEDPVTANIIKSIDTLFDINLSIEKGKLIGVCGSIGAGKSSLISAICGDVRLCRIVLLILLFHYFIIIIVVFPLLYCYYWSFFVLYFLVRLSFSFTDESPEWECASEWPACPSDTASMDLQ